MRKLLFTGVVALFLYSIHPQENSADNDKLADRVAQILVDTYGNMTGLSLGERLVLEVGRSTFYDSVSNWRAHYASIGTITIILHPQLRRLADKVYKYSSEETGRQFEEYLTQLTFLGYRNLDLYYQALRASSDVIDLAAVTVDTIDDAVANPKYFLLKKGLYEEERALKKKVRAVLSSDELKPKLQLYLFMFDFLNSIRERIIEKDLASMYSRIQKK